MAKTVDECQVAIIGGGIIGCFIGYYLSARGMDVVVIEKADLCSGATGANDACLMAQSKKPGPKLDMAVESAHMFETLANELDYDIEYVRKGSMIIQETEEEAQAMREFCTAQKDAGLPVEFLDQRETHRAQPCLSDHIIGSTVCPLDGEVNPFALLVALDRAIRRYGGRIMTNAPVVGFEVAGNRVTEVATDRGNVRADVVVCAAGAYAPLIGNMLRIEIPIRPRRGQILITEPIAPLIGAYVMSAKAIAAKHRAVAVHENNSGKDDPMQFGLGMIISQTVNGNMVLGVTHEFVGYDAGTSIRGLGSIARYTSTIIPALKGVNVIRTLAGLRPFSEVGGPVIGPIGEYANFIVVTGHEGDGVAVAPSTAKGVADKIASGAWG